MSNFGNTMNRPQSGYRPPSQGNMPPGTAQRTSYGQQAGQGQSLNQPLAVAARQGVTSEGVRTQTIPGTSHGPQRQVVDRSYIMGLLRPKVTELISEIERMRSQEETIVKNSSTLTQLSSKQKALSEEIGRLKNQLGDVNFAIQQSQTSDVDGLNSQSITLRQSNAEIRSKVDKLFLQVKDAQQQVKGQKSQLDEEMRRLDERLQSADPQAHATYARTREDAYRVADRVLEMQQEIRALTSTQEQLMSTLSMDPDKKKAAGLVLELLKKRMQRDEMARECSISVETERQNYIQQAKTTAHEIDVLNRKVVEGRDMIQESRSRLQMLDEELKEYSNDNMHKFQELQEQDREMQEFMEAFHANERDELQKIGAVEEVIQGLLERISRQEAFKAAIPKENAAVQIDAIGQEIDEKNKQLEAAKVTQQRLLGQLAEKREECERVEHLDEKITSELESTARKMQEQEQEKIKFMDLETLRKDIETRKQQLLGQRIALTKQRDASKQQMHLMSKQFEQEKDKLNEDEVQKTLVGQETKLRMVWQSTYQLEEFVRSKEKESNYTPLKAECLRHLEEINGMLREAKRPEFVMK